MTVTKYPQSCLLLEKAGKRIVIDPGSFFAAQFTVSDFGQIEAVLYTHQHPDHYDAALARLFLAAGLPLYGNADVAALIGPEANPVSHGQKFEAAGFNIQAHDLPHCLLADGSAGPPNTGYIVDGMFFHPGDGIETEALEVASMALPIAGPSISLYRAAMFARQLGAKKVIPMHYDNVDLFPGNPHGFARVFPEAEVIVLDNGQSVDL